MPRAYYYCDNDNDKRPRCSVLNVFCFTRRKRRWSLATSMIDPEWGDAIILGLAQNDSYHSGACPDLPKPIRAQPLEICITSFHSIASIRSRDALLCKSTKLYYFVFYRIPAFCNASFYTNTFSSMGYPSTRLRYLAF